MDELERLRAAVARVHALHRKATHGEDCVHCAAFGPGYDNTWPCQTIRVLDGEPQCTCGEPTGDDEDDEHARRYWQHSRCCAAVS